MVLVDGGEGRVSRTPAPGPVQGIQGGFAPSDAQTRPGGISVAVRMKMPPAFSGFMLDRMAVRGVSYEERRISLFLNGISDPVGGWIGTVG